MEWTAAAIAFLAWGVSVSTFYWTFLRPPRLEVPPCRFVGFARLRGNDQPAFVGVTLFLTNTGGKTANVDYLLLQVTDPQGRPHVLGAFSEEPFADFSARTRKPGLATRIQATTVLPFSVPGGESTTKHVVFGSGPGLTWPKGRYELTPLIALVPGREPLRGKPRQVLVESDVPVGEGFWQYAMRNSEVLELRAPRASPPTKGGPQ